MTQHTPTPWRAQRDTIIAGLYNPIARSHPIVATIDGQWTPKMNYDQDTKEANTTFIVLACNAHDALVAALNVAEQRILEVSVVNNVPGIQSQSALNQIRAALKLAQGRRSPGLKGGEEHATAHTIRQDGICSI